MAPETSRGVDMGEITRQLAEFASGIDYGTLPGAVRERTKALVSDHVAIAYRARQEAAISPSIVSTLERLGLSAGEASVIGDTRTYAPPAAAFFNGALAHCLDFGRHPRPGFHSPERAHRAGGARRGGNGVRERT